jgi:EXLDI family protein
MTLPNKTIYVTDADLPLFDRAQELAGGNLSAAIATALRRYVENEEAHEDGEIVIKVGEHGAYTKKRFQGRLVGRYVTPSADHTRMLYYRVYQTPKGNFAVHVKETPNWYRGNWSHGWEGALNDAFSEPPDRGMGERGRGRERGRLPWEAYMGDWWHPASRLDVYASLDELRGKIPDMLFQAVAGTVQHGDQGIEDLDI